MADASLIQAPTFTGTIDQRYFLEPIGGAAHPYTYLDRFPEQVYNTNPLSHLVKFLYVLLGPSGVGGLRQQYLQLRLILQERGIGQFNLDDFYGNPFAFGRILEETYGFDPQGFLTQDQWNELQQSDASYRNRAIDFMNAARAGGSPLGIYLAAKSGLGHDVEIIENYKYLYDQHSDSPLGIPYFGTTLSTEEVIILPRQDISQSEVQNIGITSPPTGGFFTLTVNGQTTLPISPTAGRLDVQNAVEALPNVGKGNVLVLGGPGPTVPWQIIFTGALSGKNFNVEFNNSLVSDGSSLGTVDVVQGGIESTDEIVSIAPQDQEQMFTALKQIKPVTSIITYNQSSGVRSRVLWNSIMASSEWTQVIRYVTGTQDTTTWIKANIENEAPKLSTGRIHHYEAFHKVKKVYAYTDDALGDLNYETGQFLPNVESGPYDSEHFGFFHPLQITLFPFLSNAKFRDYKFIAGDAVDPNPRLLTFDDVSPNGQATIEEWYPASVYTQLFKGTATHNRFWASKGRTTGTEYLELDLGAIQAINYLSFEITINPFKIGIEYDILDHTGGRRRFFPVVPKKHMRFHDKVSWVANQKQPWEFAEFNFATRKNTMIYTRYVRISFTRTTTNSPYNDFRTGTLYPYTANVRNLRIGRSVFLDDRARSIIDIDVPGKNPEYVGIIP